MAYLIELKTFSDNRGSLTVLEDKQLPFKIKRSFYIHGVKKGEIRGKHRHKKAIQAMLCLEGSCEVYNHDGKKEEWFVLDSPNKCLILEPQDWHYMKDFSDHSVLNVLSSEYFDVADYIYEPY